MTKSEKRYFHRFATRHNAKENNQYLALFEAIQKQEAYDEVLLKKGLIGKSSVRHFPVMKRYLYEQILESLHLFHQVQDAEETLKKQIHYAKILWRRGLASQAKRQLQKAEQLIQRYELTEYLPIWMEMNRRLERHTNPKLIQESYKKLDEGLELLNVSNDYWQHGAKILALHYEKVKLAEDEQGRALVEVFKTKGEPQPLRTKVHYFRALATVAFMEGKGKEAYHYNQSILQLFDEHPTLVELEREVYISVFNNFLIDNFTLGNYAMLDEGVERLRSLPRLAHFKTVPNLDARVFELTYALQLNAKVAQEQFEEGVTLLRAVERGLKKFDKQIGAHYKISLLYLSAYISFRVEDYDATLTYLNKIRASRYKKVVQELLNASEQLYILTHFELDNYLLVENLIISTRKNRRKQGIESPLEQVLFRAIRQVIQMPSKKDKLTVWKQLKEQLITIKPKEKRAWNYFDYDAWLNKKL